MTCLLVPEPLIARYMEEYRPTSSTPALLTWLQFILCDYNRSARISASFILVLDVENKYHTICSYLPDPISLALSLSSTRIYDDAYASSASLLYQSKSAKVIWQRFATTVEGEIIGDTYDIYICMYVLGDWVHYINSIHVEMDYIQNLFISVPIHLFRNFFICFYRLLNLILKILYQSSRAICRNKPMP